LTTLSGNELQTVGETTEKARLATAVPVQRTASFCAWLDRSDREGTRIALKVRWCRCRWGIPSIFPGSSDRHTVT